MIALRLGDRTIFLYCFAKSDRGNIDDKELRSPRKIASGWLAATPAQIESELKADRLFEVKYGK